MAADVRAGGGRWRAGGGRWSECLDMSSMYHTDVLRCNRFILMAVLEGGKNTPLHFTKLGVLFFLLKLQTSPISHFDRQSIAQIDNSYKK